MTTLKQKQDLVGKMAVMLHENMVRLEFDDWEDLRTVYVMEQVVITCENDDGSIVCWSTEPQSYGAYIFLKKQDEEIIGNRLWLDSTEAEEAEIRANAEVAVKITHKGHYLNYLQILRTQFGYDGARYTNCMRENEIKGGKK